VLAKTRWPQAGTNPSTRYAGQSARKHEGLLSKFFRWAILIKHLCTDNPCRYVTVEGSHKKLMVWSADVFHSVRDALGSSDVLLSFEEYKKITGVHTTIADLLAMPGIEDIELEISPSRDPAQPADLS
jgi:hypothetical protein